MPLGHLDVGPAVALEVGKGLVAVEGDAGDLGPRDQDPLRGVLDTIGQHRRTDRLDRETGMITP